MTRIVAGARPAAFASRGVDDGSLVDAGGAPARVIGFGAGGAVCLTGDWTLSERATGEVAAPRAEARADSIETIRAIASVRPAASAAETVAAVEEKIEWYAAQRSRGRAVADAGRIR